MTAQLLPQVANSPFGKHFDRKPYVFQDVPSLASVLPGISSTSLNTILTSRSRQISPVSVLSAISAPALNNNENIAPVKDEGYLCSTPVRSFSTNVGEAHSARQPPLSKLLHTVGTPKKTKPLLAHEPGRSAGHSRKKHIENDCYTKKTSNEDLANKPLLGATTSSDGTLDLGQNRSKKSSINDAYVLEPGRRATCVDGDETAKESISSMATKSIQPTIKSATKSSISSINVCTPMVDQSFLSHRKNLSTSSSGFVRSLKTASFTNASFSVMTKSLRFGRSSDSYALFGSYHRFSTDSDRPPTSSSLDDAAIRRGLSRSQIVEELTATEESYVADLKALAYMLSTLLVSGTTMSSRTRSAIQRNVLELLHLHEHLLEQLHRTSFRAAARKWADTVSPRQLQGRYHRRLRSAGSHLGLRIARMERLKRSSSDSYDQKRARNWLSTADPKDVSDIISIYKDCASQFFAYEEYCANHDILAYELHRHLPNLWSIYEGGMESLARSLVSLNHRQQNKQKGITVGDLLIKPIQRVCKYPLLFDDLLKQTPAADCPSAHSEIEETLHLFRGVVRAVNTVTDNPEARSQIHKRWALQSRLTFSRIALLPGNFRLLGNIILCGVLHVTYQTRSRADGTYALCVLFDNDFIIAIPAGSSGKFDIVAFIHLSDLKLESACDGKGLQCQSAHHTWKLSFMVEGHLHELLLSACSSVEQEQWKRGLRGEFVVSPKRETTSHIISSCIALDLKSVGLLYGYGGTLTRRLSVQRAATVANRASICQVIIRNTHNPQDLHEFRQPSTSAINRSQSHMTTHRIIVLAPKRSERARLENLLGDIWTKDKLPYPGMIASRGGQIIRASAGSLVRKLSLASIHGPFSRRSVSLSLSSRKSYETFMETKSAKERDLPRRFEVRKNSFEEAATYEIRDKKPNDIPELDTMDRLVHRMIGDTTNRREQKPSMQKVEKADQSRPKHKRSHLEVSEPADRNVSAKVFEKEKSEKNVVVEGNLQGGRKRWSNPIGMLKGLSAEGIRHMLYSTK